MGTRKIVRDTGSSGDPEKALREIRNNAIMLTMAVKYICEDPFLKKMGETIEDCVGIIRNHVQELETKKVGKAAEEVNLTGSIEGITRISKMLQEAEKGTNDQCVKGALGRQLGEQVTSLDRELKILRGKVDGGSVEYTRSDSVKGTLDSIGFFAGPFKKVLKVVVVLVLACAAAFAYLFITMESEKDLQHNIDQCTSVIMERQAAIKPIDEELARVRKEIETGTQQGPAGKEKTALMELNLKAFDLAEKKEKIQIEINIQQSELEKNQKRLNSLKNKSLMDKILRR